MPVHRCWRKGERGWQWGSQKCYLPSEEGSDEAAREKAEEQGRAIEGQRNNMLTININLKSKSYETRNQHPSHLSK